MKIMYIINIMYNFEPVVSLIRDTILTFDVPPCDRMYFAMEEFDVVVINIFNTNILGEIRDAARKCRSDRLPLADLTKLVYELRERWVLDEERNRFMRETVWNMEYDPEIMWATNKAINQHFYDWVKNYLMKRARRDQRYRKQFIRSHSDLLPTDLSKLVVDYISPKWGIVE
jgi:hypothetical protein